MVLLSAHPLTTAHQARFGPSAPRAATRITAGPAPWRYQARDCATWPSGQPFDLNSKARDLHTSARNVCRSRSGTPREARQFKSLTFPTEPDSKPHRSGVKYVGKAESRAISVGALPGALRD